MTARLPAAALDTALALERVGRVWDEDILRQLTDYIRIPAKSPGFSPDWRAQGHLETVLRNAAQWVEAQKVAGLRLEIVRLDGRTPVLFFEVEATRPQSTQTVLMYGHLDKQPEFEGWRADLGPWTPKYEDGKLYGRGGADDGYAVYASIAAVQELQRQNVPHPRIVGLIETCEESGSADLLPYIDLLRGRLGDVALVICLDSGAGNYDQLWLTTSLRGMASGTLKVEILTEGVHSGDSSGLVPSSFRIMRQVLDRLEDSTTGRLLPASFHCEMPADRLAQARATAAILGDEVYKRFPWAHRLRRQHGVRAAHHHRPGRGADPPHLAAHAQRHRRRGLPRPAGRGQRAAPLHRLQAQPAPAAAGGRGRLRAGNEGLAGGQRTLPGPRDLRARRRRQWLERPGHRSVVRPGAGRRQPGALRRALRLHRPGRHHPAHEHAEPGLPQGADDGLRRARPQEQCARPQRIPARALRQAPHRRRGPGGRCPACLNTAPAMQDLPESTLSPFTAGDGENLAVRDWPLPTRERRGTVLVVHGLGEHSARYRMLAARLNGWGSPCAATTTTAMASRAARAAA